MIDLREAVAIAMKKEREKVLAQPLARIWPDLSAAALRAIEEAGYVVVKRQPVQQPQMGYLQYAVQGDIRSYADRADGATSFDGELQFEIDRAKEGL